MHLNINKLNIGQQHQLTLNVAFAFDLRLKSKCSFVRSFVSELKRRQIDFWLANEICESHVCAFCVRFWQTKCTYLLTYLEVVVARARTLSLLA